jgi:MATE family multidrug resistance protein
MIGCHIYTTYFTDERLRREAWFFPTAASFKIDGLIQFMKLGLPSIGMLCLEWWSFELMTLYSAFISMKATAVQIIILNTAVITFMPAVGLHIAAATLVGRYIGAQNVPAARR